MRYSKVLVALLAAPFLACEDEPTQPNNTPTPTIVATATAFNPANLTVVPDDSVAGSESTTPSVPVVWQFTSGTHNVVFEDGQPGSGTMSAGTFERKFTAAPATYRYRCTLHSSDFTTGMVGRIVVAPE